MWSWMIVGRNQFFIFYPFAPTALASTRGGVLTLYDLFVMATAGYLVPEALALSLALTFPRWQQP